MLWVILYVRFYQTFWFILFDAFTSTNVDPAPQIDIYSGMGHSMARMNTLRHAAFIPDGSRRYAQRMNITFEEAYLRGAAVGQDVVHESIENGIEHISFFVSSLALKDVRGHMEMFSLNLGVLDFFKKIAFLHGAKLHVIGSIPSHGYDYAIGDSLRRIIEAQHTDTDYQKVQIYVFIEHDTREIVKDIPSVDLLIRTGGIRSLSGFLPLQCAHAILQFHDMLWQEYSKEIFRKDMSWFHSVDRTLGV